MNAPKLRTRILLARYKSDREAIKILNEKLLYQLDPESFELTPPTLARFASRARLLYFLRETILFFSLISIHSLHSFSFPLSLSVTLNVTVAAVLDTDQSNWKSATYKRRIISSIPG